MALLIAHQKKDPFLVRPNSQLLPSLFNHLLFIFNFLSLDFVYFRFVVEYLTKEKDQLFDSESNLTSFDKCFSKLCSFEKLISLFNEIEKKSFTLKRITKEMKKFKSKATVEKIVFFSKENHEYSTMTESLENEYDIETGTFKEKEAMTEEESLKKILSRIDRDLEKSMKSVSKTTDIKDEVASKVEPEIERQKQMKWEMFYWWNLHGPNWLADKNYWHSLVSYYKANPLKQLMSSPEKNYQTNEQNLGIFFTF